MIMRMAAVLLALAPMTSHAALSDNDRRTVGYEVPVADESLKEFARFQIDDYRVRYHDDRLEVTYKLPAHLTGEETRVQFAGPVGETSPSVLVGDGRMECTSTQCRVKYEGVEIDTAKRDAFLRTVSRSSRELSARISVAESFRIDPGGVILFGEYPLRAKSCESSFR